MEITYYLYHIPGKKIGVTRNLNKRVTIAQGYQPDEYEVLESSNDIDYISTRELELQSVYGYKIDRKLYKQLFNQMNLNTTEQTTTFPCPVNKLKGMLMDNMGMEFMINDYRVILDGNTIKWIMENANTSMYNPNRCYVYNKALTEWYVNSITKWITSELEKPDAESEVEQLTVFHKIRSWAEDRGIYDKGDVKTQYVKLLEEIGELAKSILKNDDEEFVDAIGDCVVVLTNLAKLKGYEIEDCIDHAYTIISKRQGKMVNGTFVKNKKSDWPHQSVARTL
jgi:NTP pyrophosphatase (non-canonical NTP hydrolase)